MTKRDLFSVWAFVLVLLTEISTVLAMRLEIKYLWWIPVILIVAIICLRIMGNRMNLEFRFKEIVVSNLLANIIAPRMISVLYLLFFVIHIGWLTDGSLNLFFPDAYEESCEIIVSLIVGSLGMLVLILFFPRSAWKKDVKTIPVFVSGISIPTIPFIRPSEPNSEDYKYKKINLRPLVRILQDVDDNQEDIRILILITKDLNDGSAQNLRKVLEFIDNGLVNEFDSCNDIEAKTRLLIKAVAQKEFPDKKCVSNLEDKIFFTKPCDYDDFNACYEILNDEINKYDKPIYHLNFNITPGTSNISALMTLMAMDPQRELYYYQQKEGLNEENRLRKIEKDYETLKNLFSKNLEKIQNENT